MSKRIIRNAARCRLCGSMIESKELYDNQTCMCGEVSVEGGQNYIGRFASTDWNNIIDLSEYKLTEGS